MNGDEVAIDVPCVGRILEVEEPLAGVGIRPLAEVIEERPDLLQCRHGVRHDFCGIVVERLASCGEGVV